MGLHVLGQLRQSIRKAHAIQFWSEAPGKIVESATRGNWSGGGGKLIWTVEPKITYRYLVNGQEYVGHDISLTEINIAERQDSEEKIKPFPVGREVTVYYDPSKPEDSVLQKQTTLAPFVIFGVFGAILLVLGILAVLGVGRWGA